jgi:putative endonuclease
MPASDDKWSPKMPPLPRTPRVPGLRPKPPKGDPSPERQAAFSRGISAESVAAAWLIGKGYRILARRFRCAAGEIDIVAGRRHTVIFVEVKARASFDEAAEAVSVRQRARIAMAAEIWLANNPKIKFQDLRFDAILIVPGKLPRHIPGAFET